MERFQRNGKKCHWHTVSDGPCFAISPRMFCLCLEVECCWFPLCSISSPVSTCRTCLSVHKSKVNFCFYHFPVISHFTPCSDLVVRILRFYSCTCLNLNSQQKKNCGGKKKECLLGGFTSLFVMPVSFSSSCWRTGSLKWLGCLRKVIVRR